MRRIKFLLLLVFISFSLTNDSQVLITGKVSNSNKENLNGVNVIITETGNSKIIAYDISNSDGRFEITLNSELKSFKISASLLGYKNKFLSITNKSQEINFILVPSVEHIDEVIIKVSPISNRKDTIYYDVNQFKTKKDRSIGDVLNNMPGIEINNNGMILYQGKPIQKFYIEGLDLLEGKYNLASNNLPADAVSQVQIYENHQPVKVLENIISSDRASLNIKLKDKVATTGTVKTGIGALPILWDINLTPMLFTKRYQMISSYQSNNDGNDVAKDINILSFGEIFYQFQSNSKKRDWLEIQAPRSPNLSRNRWLNNNVHLLTLNQLVRIKKDFDFKINVSYLNDYQIETGATQTTLFTNSDTINFSESIKNKIFLNSFKSKFVLMKNTKKIYIKNEINLNKHWDSKSGILLSNDSTINQILKNPFFLLSNDLSLMKKTGNKIIGIKSKISFSETPQSLTVEPGIFNDLLNNGINSGKTEQNISYINMFTDNSVQYTGIIGKMSYISETGFTFQNQSLESKLIVVNNEEENILNNYFQNNLNYTSQVIYSNNTFQLNIDFLKTELKLPLKLYNHQREDNYLNKTENLKTFAVEPAFYLRKKINAFWKINIAFSLNKMYGNIEKLFYGYMLRNYREIQFNSIPISESNRRVMSCSVFYKNPLNSIFINSFYTYSNNKNNYIAEKIINEKGASIFKIHSQNSYSESHNISLRTSKFLSNISSYLSFSAKYSYSISDQILNSTLSKLRTNEISFESRIKSEISKWFDAEYKNNFSFINSYQNNQITLQTHHFVLSFFPVSYMYIGINTEYSHSVYFNTGNDNYYINLNSQYTFKTKKKHRKIDIKLNWNNVLNTKEYITVYEESFLYYLNTYELRPSQIIMTLLLRL